MHTNLLITFTRPRAVLCSFFLILFLTNFAQGQTSPKPVAAWLESFRTVADFKPLDLFQRIAEPEDLQTAVEKASVLRLNPKDLESLRLAAPQALLFAIPTAEGATIELELIQVEILSPEFSVKTNTEDPVNYHPSIHYRGLVRGNPNSIACLSVSDEGLMGMVADDSGTYELGQMENTSGHYIYYKTQHLKALSPNSCFSEEESLFGDGWEEPSVEDRGVGCKTVQVYFECDYKLYTDKGSNTTSVSNYVSGLFNQVATLYANENIGIAISQIFVWTSADPYMGYTNTSAVLNAFRQTRGTSFNGTVAHLLSTRNLGGGIAYVDVICVKQYAFGVSAINTTFQNVPTYSWSVEVVTHELGHNLGSWHTHSCNWPSGALDNCVNPEGTCAPGPTPVNGGTIMSYCHLTGNGINFNKGFGPVPGARIRDKVLNANCVPQSGTVPTGLTTSNITGTTATLKWLPVAGSTTYTVQYKLSTANSWTTAGNTSAATYNLINLTANSNYQWQVKTDCSNFSPTASFTTSTGGGGGSSCNAPSGLQALNITATAATLNWGAVAGATNYTIQYKISSSSFWNVAGSTSATTLTLSNLTASSNYQWQVKANCSVYSITASFSTPAGGGNTCDAPTGLKNNTISSNYAIISWSPVTNATSYTIQIKLVSQNDWFTLGAVSVTNVVISGLQPGTSYHWRVKTNCSDYSGAKLLTTTANIDGDGTENLNQPSLLENKGVGSLAVFPNPAQDFLQVRFVDDLFGQYQLVMANSLGQIVSRQAFQNTLEVSNLEPGIYFLSLMDGSRRIATERFVKVK